MTASHLIRQRRFCLCWFAAIQLLLAEVGSAGTATRYVWAASPSPSPPYTSWDTASHDMQPAVDASAAGDTVLVTNGVYNTGGSAVDGIMTNRVVVNKAVFVKSVNGPGVTFILGRGVGTGSTNNGDGAIRCIYLGANATLSGFTLTSGHTRAGAGLPSENSGGGAWCQSGAVLTNCILNRNSATNGGGVCNGYLVDCTLSQNWVKGLPSTGGGAANATLNHCSILGNWELGGFGGGGGGVFNSVLSNCVLATNWVMGTNGASHGGGAKRSTLYHCVLKQNWTGGSFDYGGGAIDSGLNNCLLYANSVTGYCATAGGAAYSILANCTVVSNTARYGAAGGVYDCTNYNGIVYYNQGIPGSGTNYGGGTWDHSCTTPLPAGTANMTNAPAFVDPTNGNFHLLSNSLCIDAGLNSAAPPGITDLDGNPRIFGGTVDMGAYETIYGNVPVILQQPQSVTIEAGTNTAFTAAIRCSAPVAYQWLKDGANLQDRANLTGAFTPSLQLTAAQLADSGNYSLVISNAYGAVTSAVAVLTVEYHHPVITTPPIDQTVMAGAGAMFGVAAWSLDSPKYQWYVNQVPVPGGTHSTLPALACQPAQTGDRYYVVISDSFGSVTSQVATLIVTVGSEFAGLVAYYPFAQNATDLSGQGNDGSVTGAVLAPDRFGRANAAYNFCGVGMTPNYIDFSRLPLTQTDNWSITAWLCPSSLSQAGIAVELGSSAGFAENGFMLQVGNYPGFPGNKLGGLLGGVAWVDSGYAFDSSTQWHQVVMLREAGVLKFYVDGLQTPGTSTAEPTTPTSFRIGSGAGNGYFQGAVDEVRVYNRALSAQEVQQLFALENAMRPGLVSQPQSQTVYATSNVTFNVSAYGTMPLGYQWYENNLPLGNGTNVTLQILNAQAPQTSNTYFVVVSNGFGAVTSQVATLTVVPAQTRYVSATSPNPRAPFTTWDTAAHTLQEAVDVAVQNDTIMVTNGAYGAGGYAAYGTMTNRVVITNAITVQSVNGPAVTWIVGAAGWEGTNGDGAMRCAWLGTNTVLSGFTLTNGHTRNGGDAVHEQSGGGVWCLTNANALVTNCVLTGNAAYAQGGGAYCGTFVNCIFRSNMVCGGDSGSGGGSWGSMLTNCVLSGNLVNATSGGDGGGSYGGTLDNCAISGNTVAALTGNGGGVHSGVLNNCTLTGNAAPQRGGGAYNAKLTNCIVYYNTAALGGNYDAGELAYCCTTPLPAGVGNFSDDPRLASSYHLSAASPCLGRGIFGACKGTDLDGDAWQNPPCVGADQSGPGLAAGPLAVTASGAYAKVAAGFPVALAATGQGHMTGGIWDFADGSVATNRPYLTHAWNVPGLYPVRFIGYNDSHPGGVSATALVWVVRQPVYYVNAANGTPMFPYADWGSAASNIQDAIDAGTLPGRLVLVTNGVYNTGGRLVLGSTSNRVVLTGAVLVQSVGGPAVTQIAGAAEANGAIRCVYVDGKSVLSGFTLTNGHTVTSGYGTRDLSGGGAWCETGGVLTNCLVVSNTANYGGGGGAYRGTLINCTLKGNATERDGSGGGAFYSTLKGCLLTGNSATGISSGSGGGASYATLDNCVLSGNSASGPSANGGGAYYSLLNNCVLSGNSVNATPYYGFGGGAYDGTLNNCTLVSNTASGSAVSYGGGARYSVLRNCILYYNNAGSDANYANCTFSYSCTTPLPSGTGNIAGEPGFVSLASGDFRLSPASPCRDAGTDSFVEVGWTDLDGKPRILGGHADIGGYEYGAISLIAQSPQSQTNMTGGATVLSVSANQAVPLSYQWFKDGCALSGQTSSVLGFEPCGLSDSGQYWVVVSNGYYGCATSQVATLTVHLRASSPCRNSAATNSFGLNVGWSETNRLYRLQFKTNLLDPVWQTIGPWLPGSGSNLGLLDACATNGLRLYRLESTNQ